MFVKELNIAFDSDFLLKRKDCYARNRKQLNLLKKKLKIMSLTKTFLNTESLNIWNNDKFLRTN